MNDWRETARRLAAHPKWLEASKVQKTAGVRLVEFDEAPLEWRVLGWDTHPLTVAPHDGLVYDSYKIERGPDFWEVVHNVYPDLTDPATAGVLLGMLRDAVESPGIWKFEARCHPAGGMVYVAEVWLGAPKTKGPEMPDITWSSREHAAEAVALALLDAWGS